MSELPNGWARARLDELANLNPKQNFDDGLTAGFVPMSHAPTNFRDKLRFNERNWGEIKKAYTNFKDGDVIFAKVTPCFENGKAALVNCLPNGIGAGSSEFFVLRPNSTEVSAKYILALIKSRDFMREGAANMTGAVGLRRVPRQFVENYVVPVPPAAEQTRIAQKLNELLTQVDTLKARIDSIPTLLKRFRQSVLAAAVSGQLTEEWRLAHTHSGKATRIVKLSEIAVKITDGEHITPPMTDSGVPLLSAKDVQTNYLGFDQCRYLSREVADKALSRCDPTRGDILIVSRGATVGRTHRVQIDNEFCLMGSVLLIRPDLELIHSEYLEISFTSLDGQKQLTGTSGSSAQQAIYIRDVKNFSLTLPTLEEQTEIVRRVEQLFIFAYQLEAKVAAAKSRIDHLTQSILAKAFRGELVPQNPNDEPASILLERIKAQRAAAPKVKRSRKTSA